MRWHFNLGETPQSPLLDNDLVTIAKPSGTVLVVARVVGLRWLNSVHEAYGRPPMWIWNLGKTGMVIMPSDQDGCTRGGAFTTDTTGQVPPYITNHLGSLGLIYESAWMVWQYWTPGWGKSTKDDRWPDKCDRCSAPAWIGPVQITCSAGCCRERK